MTVSTSKYEFTHGKTPRGYGWWIFKAIDGTEYVEIGMYTEAKKQAVRKAKNDGKLILVVQP